MRMTLLLCLLLVGGCADEKEIAKVDDAKCQSYGAKPGEPAYVQCRAQLDAARTIAKNEGGPAPVIPPVNAPLPSQWPTH